ncbi:MAG: LysE family transporter [Owenweeksia sp.]|nr:LysE family transporter [Owenweeksia sp.]
MLEILLLALPLGIALSFAAGPIFFVVVETSISIGKTKALMLDLGAVTANAVFIVVAFYGSQSLIHSLQNNIWVTIASALAVITFGLYYILKSKRSGQFQRGTTPSRKRHYYFKGFLLNFFNVGVLFYWLATTVAVGSILNHHPTKMLVFYTLIIGVYLFIDIFKIYFANRFKEKLKGRKLQIVEKILGLMLIGFGVFLVVRNLLL